MFLNSVRSYKAPYQGLRPRMGLIKLQSVPHSSFPLLEEARFLGTEARGIHPAQGVQCVELISPRVSFSLYKHESMQRVRAAQCLQSWPVNVSLLGLFLCLQASATAAFVSPTHLFGPARTGPLCMTGLKTHGSFNAISTKSLRSGRSSLHMIAGAERNTEEALDEQGLGTTLGEWAVRVLQSGEMEDKVRASEAAAKAWKAGKLDLGPHSRPPDRPARPAKFLPSLIPLLFLCCAV